MMADYGGSTDTPGGLGTSPSMRNKFLLSAIILSVFTGSFLARAWMGPAELTAAPDARRCERMITMAPSVTEIVFALGLGDRVIGVTRFCRYPPEAQARARVGGFLDPNFEAVVALRPDLIVMLTEHAKSMPAFHKLGLPVLVVSHQDVTGILDSIPAIGRACGAEARARRIVADIEGRMEHIRRKTAGLPRPRVLFVIERTLGNRRLEDVYVAGSDGFFDKIIALAGGKNAYAKGSVRFPVVSAEGILWMNPQVIIDMTAGLAGGQLSQETILADWQQLAEVEAVRNGRVHAVDQDYAFVPGPRFIRLVEDLARPIHPEVDWDEDGEL